MNEGQAFTYGFGLAALLVGAVFIGWDNAMRFSRKLERHNVDLANWHADQGDAGRESLPEHIRRLS